MNFKAVDISDKGNFRKSNQDFIGFKENKYGQFMAVVSDGMGGHAHGEIASKIACETLLVLFENQNFSKLSKSKIDKWLRLSILAIKQKMEEYAFAHLEAMDMGTTLTALLITEQGAYIINIGDSRTYKLINDNLKQITVDQNLLNDERMFSRTNTSFENNLNEITYWKILVSALGPTKTLKIDTFHIADPKGTYLLTTDGVHDYVDETDGYEILTSKQKMKTKAKEFIELAKMNLSKDNLSLIIVEVI